MENQYRVSSQKRFDLISINVFHVSSMVFLVLWSLITLLSFSSPQRSLLTDSDFMMRSSTQGTGDVISNDKNRSNQRLSQQGKRKLLGYSALVALILAIGVHALHLYFLY